MTNPITQVIKENLKEYLLRSCDICEDGCWVWNKFKNKGGYGKIRLNKPERVMRSAHAVSYEVFGGKIPDGYVVDHLCRNRACINPKHLEAVTQKENILRGIGPTAKNSRKTMCLRGHEFTPENTFINVRGERVCISCKRLRDRRRTVTWSQKNPERAREYYRNYYRKKIRPKRIALKEWSDIIGEVVKELE